MNQGHYDDIRQLIVDELKVDFVGLWEIVRVMRERRPGADDNEIRQGALNIVAELLLQGSAVAGFPSRSGGFCAWQSETEATCSRIEKEWESLGRDPDIGEIVWLAPKHPKTDFPV